MMKIVVRVLDVLSYVLWGETERPLEIAPWSRLAVVKVDHIGDLIMCTAFLYSVRKQRPDAHVTLITGTWNRDIALWLAEKGLIQVVQWWDLAACNKRASHWKRIWREATTTWSTVWRLCEYPVDAFVELRPRSPNGLFLGRLVDVPWRVGFGVRGLAFTLHRELPYDDKTPLGQLFLGALPAIGLQLEVYRGPVLPASSETGALCKELVGQSDGYGIIHPFSNDRARELSVERWRALFNCVVGPMPWFFLGTYDDMTEHEDFVQLAESKGIRCLAGKTTLRDVLCLVGGARCVMCVESMVAHLALAYQVPSVVLMNDVASARNAYPIDSGCVLFSYPNEHVIAVKQLLDDHNTYT